MLKGDLGDKLKETLAICDLHNTRMMFAWENIGRYFPLTETILGNLSPVELAFFDQLIYRFSKLQDSMGTRLFRQLLESLEEDVSALPFIDILNRMERLNLIPDAREWIALRQTRNTVSHEYPFFKEIQADELNLLGTDVVKLSAIWSKLRDYTMKRFKV
jgi:hypothetical protein